MSGQADTRAPAQAAGRTVDRATLARVFWRSLFLQAAWNPHGMQNLGFAYALYPALERLYPDPQDLSEATGRHLACFFNCHPYAAAAILGGALHYEERIARGEVPKEAVNAYKQSLMGPLAALGDGFFWLSLRPASGAVGALLALLFGLWGVAFFLLSYNAVHVLLRARFFRAGYRLGDGVVGAVGASRLPSFGERLRVLAAAAVGGAAALVVAGAPARFPGPAWAGPALGGAALLFAAFHALLGKGVSPYAVAYGGAALALSLALVF